jgi:chromosome segregation ATPase
VEEKPKITEEKLNNKGSIIEELSTGMTSSIHIRADTDEQASYISVQNEVPLLKLEIQKRERDNEELVARITALNKRISELESVRKSDDTEKLDLLNLRITELESKLNFAEQKKNKLDSENKKLKEEISKNE